MRVREEEKSEKMEEKMMEMSKKEEKVSKRETFLKIMRELGKSESILIRKNGSKMKI